MRKVKFDTDKFKVFEYLLTHDGSIDGIRIAKDLLMRRDSAQAVLGLIYDPLLAERMIYQRKKVNRRFVYENKVFAMSDKEIKKLYRKVNRKLCKERTLNALNKLEEDKHLAFEIPEDAVSGMVKAKLKSMLIVAICGIVGIPAIILLGIYLIVKFAC